MYRKLFTYPIALLLFWACDQTQPYPYGELLADVQWVQTHIDNDLLRIVDMRSEGFEEGHIPGAVHLAGAGALVDEGHEIDNYLIPVDRFEELIRGLGISNEHTVLIYDEGNSLNASRLFYALELYGHDKAKILNGGFAAWQAEEGELVTDMREITPGNFTAASREALVCDLNYVRENINNEEVLFFDARSLSEHIGEDIRAERGGHIPGAVHLEWNETVENNKIPYFKPAHKIQALLAAKGITPDKEVIPYCQSNVRGSHVYFTLRLMGYESVRPYEGSWSEYGNVEGVPVN